MKISELIKTLAHVKFLNGNVEIHVADKDDGSLSDPNVEWVDGKLVIW